jgi:hypothetical protein
MVHLQTDIGCIAKYLRTGSKYPPTHNKHNCPPETSFAPEEYYYYYYVRQPSED